MVEGLTQDQVKDLIYVGAFHYEALLRERDLVDDAKNIITGTVPYTTWETQMLADFGKVNATELVRRYLPNAYIRSKATLLGALTLAKGTTQFERWRADVLSDLSDDERTKINPYLREVFETSQRLAAESRPRTQNDVSPTSHNPFTANRNQRAALIAGAIVFIVMLLVPPWHYSSGRSYGYHFLFWPPARSIFIDSTRLIVQCVLVAALTLGAFVVLRTKRD